MLIIEGDFGNCKYSYFSEYNEMQAIFLRYLAKYYVFLVILYSLRKSWENI